MDNKFQEAETFRYLILAVQRQGNRMFKGYLKEIGITPSQAEVIRVLKDLQPISLKELGRLLICEEGSPSRLVDRMVKDGQIERIKDKNDSRFVRLALTGLGNQTYFELVKAETEMYKTVEQVYTKEELQLSNQLLSRLLKGTPLLQAFDERGLTHAWHGKKDDQNEY